MNPRHLANYAAQVVNEFARTRDPSFKLHADYLNTYLRDHFLGNATQLRRDEALCLAMMIFSASTFIDWKLLTDIDSTCAEIAKNNVTSLNTITRALGFSKSKHDLNTGNSLKKILLLSQMDLLSNNGAASVIRDAVFNFHKYVEPSADDVELHVACVRRTNNEKSLHEGLGLKGPRITANYISSYAALPTYIESVQPDLVIFDYFQSPLITLPYLCPGPSYAYFSHGLVPLILDGVDAILVHGGVIGNQTLGAIRALSRHHADSLITLPMAGNGGNRIASTPSGYEADLISKIRQKRAEGAQFAVTLCRREKISADYLQFINNCLEAQENLIFVCAGPGVDSARNLIKSERAWFSPAVNPDSVLSLTDVYLETFPEHQGISPLDAMRSHVPVLCLHNSENQHLLLSRRPASGIRHSPDELVKTLKHFLSNDATKQKALAEQSSILTALESEEAEFWPTILNKLSAPTSA